ncbi:MAG TPA: two-component regulator propeller domain-containing protein, partial [Verrucomicrobiae bacterium]|nr:two-component regulator propeller domain-containing protein [Verrucomicrobiae bacterium]
FGLLTTGADNLANTGPPNKLVAGVTNVNYLVASAQGGFWCLADGHIQRWHNGRKERDLGAYPWNQHVTAVTCACEDREGNLVVGTFGAGVYWFDASGGFVHLSRRQDMEADGDQGLSQDSILCLLVDREGNLWVGTNGGGLNRVRRSPFGVLAGSENRTVQSVCADTNGGLWVGYFGGVAGDEKSGAEPGGAVEYFTNFSDGKRRVWATNQDCWTHSVFVDHRGQAWAGTWGPWERWALPAGGLFTNIQNGATPVAFAVALNQMFMVQTIQAVSAIFQDEQNRMWIGSREGLFEWDGTKWLTPLTAHNGLSSDDVRAIAEDAESNLWIGTENGGLNRLRDGKFTAVHKQDGLPSEHISALYRDQDGVLWVGTSGGLAWLRNGKWNRYTSREGLFASGVDYLVDDALGNLWLGTSRGLVRVPKHALDQLADGLTNYVSCRTFGESDGMPNSECTSGSQPAAGRTPDGQLWFPTINGLVHVDPRAIKPNTNAPPVVIEGVSIEGQAQGAQGLGAVPPKGVSFPAGREHLEIQFASLNLGAADKARFSYLMQGYETNWVSAGTSRSAPYSKLPPGSYTFLVKACNEDGVWSVSPASLAVKVLPPFWRKWWFIMVSSLCLLGMMAGIVHYVSTQRLYREVAGLRQQQALEKERARIARDIHDQLGASVTQVSLLGEMLESDKDQPAEVESHAKQITQTARDVSRVLDEIVWTVNPSNDTLEGLVNYICKYAQEYLAVAGLKYRLEAPAQLPGATISPEVRHNVFLAAKESITNVVRHARATSAFIRVRLDHGTFTLEIEDDGRGIEKVAEKMAGSRNGLRNMSRRMEDVGGRFEISPGPAGGTLVKLTVPIKMT